MPSFRRAQLSGSDELFRPTQSEAVQTELVPTTPPAAVTRPAPRVSEGAPHEGTLVRLTDGDVQLIADALQRLKYPQKSSGSKPAVEEYERVEDLRQRLLAQLD